jgi:hypothetical protein
MRMCGEKSFGVKDERRRQLEVDFKLLLGEELGKSRCRRMESGGMP